MENSENNNRVYRQGYFEKGGKAGPGRPKGSQSRTTKELRRAYQNLVDNNIENMTEWLEQIAAESPEKAMDMILKLSEYVMPKMSRQEITGEDGKDILTNIQFTFGPDVNQQDPGIIDQTGDTPQIDS